MATPEIQQLCAFNAFESQLKTLCLNEFPCGIGNWRENHKKKKKHIEKDKVSSKFSVTLKDYGSRFEKAEGLSELVSVKKSPWNQDYSWSDEAKKLREVAVQSPWLIDESFVLEHFRTLRIVDKEVTEVDEEFLKFRNLSELSLSANYLRTVNSNNLPCNLKVLELCGNQISNLADLCMNPPALVHLGLGHNCLTMVDDYITSQYWPQLLSLDLCHNNLTDLMDIVRKLQTLPKLRNLILQGNPLSLIPGYRGYTIDSIRNLDFLDDISISADEKHHYKGLAKRKEYILDEAKMVFRVEHLRGVPMPEEMKLPDEQPEFPIITRKYFVQFMYLEGRSTNAEIFHILHDDEFSSGAPTQRTVGSQLQSVADTGHLSGDQMGSMQTLNAPASTIEPEAPIEAVADERVCSEMGSQMAPLEEEDLPPEGSEEVPGGLRLAPIKSSDSTWMEDMQLNWVKVCTRDDLLSLRNFLREGIDISVMEEKSAKPTQYQRHQLQNVLLQVLSYPADQVQDGTVESPAAGSKSKDSKGKDAKGKKDEKGKDSKPPEDAKKKKKKGEPDVELFHMPPEYTSLAEFHLQLADMLEGDLTAEAIFMKSGEEMEGNKSPTGSESSSKKHCEKKDKKKDKPGSGKKKESARDPKEPKKSLTGAEKGKDKGSKGGKGAEIPMDDENPPLPPPLELKVGLRLHHWVTAKDCTQVLEGEGEDGDDEDGEDESKAPSAPPAAPGKKAK